MDFQSAALIGDPTISQIAARVAVGWMHTRKGYQKAVKLIEDERLHHQKQLRARVHTLHDWD